MCRLRCSLELRWPLQARAFKEAAQSAGRSFYTRGILRSFGGGGFPDFLRTAVCPDRNLTPPLVAFLTGAMTLWFVMTLAREGRKIPTHSLILAGVVMQSFLGAVVSFLSTMSKQTINEIIYWTMGSLALRGWSYTAILFPYFLLGLIFLWSRARSLNVLALGERQAAHIGVGVDRLKLSVLAVGTPPQPGQSPSPASLASLDWSFRICSGRW